MTKVNGTWACENDKMINGVLKGELNFQGYMVSLETLARSDHIGGCLTHSLV